MIATVKFSREELNFLIGTVEQEKYGWEKIQDAAPNIYAEQHIAEVTAVLEKLKTAYFPISVDVETDGRTAQEIEGSCEGCMHIDCERDERPCSDCCRLDRVDRYEEEDPTLADVFPELHGGKDANHET